MSRQYDTRTTIFSPEGRLYQVEYAMEAIGHAGTCLGILASDGVLLAAERKNVNKLLDDVIFSEKIYKLDVNIACSVAGITSDANVLTNYLRQVAQRYTLQYQESIPCEQLVMRLCDLKQAYTQFGGAVPGLLPAYLTYGGSKVTYVPRTKNEAADGLGTRLGKRPFGVSILYMGWDPHFGFQLYQSDPSGNYGGWKATCIGNNHQAAISMLKQEYKEPPTLKEALQLAVKILNKTLDSAKLNAERVEFATLTRTGEGEAAQTQIRVLPATEVDTLIQDHMKKEEERKREEKAKEEKAKAERAKAEKQAAAKTAS